MKEVVNKINAMTDSELKEVVRQLDELNKVGGTNKQPLRSLLDDAGANALITVSLVVYKEAAERWIKG